MARPAADQAFRTGAAGEGGRVNGPGRRWLIALLVCAAALAGCEEDDSAQALQARAERESAQQGGALIRLHGCGSCHEIPGIRSARGNVGPPLDRFAQRAYVAGILPNTYENAASWIENPQAHDPDTAMPDMGLTRQEARAVAAWLYRE